jgi:hypothetical protein
MDRITGIEYLFFNNLHIFFTIGLDNTVKAWTLGPDQNSIVPQGTMNLPAAPLSIAVGSPTLILIGL